MKSIITKLVLFFSITASLLGQSRAGAIFLLIPPSPTMNGLGRGIGVSLPSDDPFAGYLNPANGLQLFEGIAYHYSKLKTSWLPNLADDMYLSYDVLNVGLLPQKYPFKAVLSFHETYLDLNLRSYLKAEALTLGVGFRKYFFGKLPIDFSFGLTRKKAIQVFYENPGARWKSSNIFYDYGTLISLPISPTNLSFIIKEEFRDNFQIQFTPSFGYSISNVGGEVSFIDPSMGDPSPRYLRTGLASSFSFSYKSLWKIIEWKGGRSASDILAVPRYSSDDPIKYQSGFDNDIDFIRNVIKSKSDSAITIHRGDEWTFFEIYTFRFGREIDVTGGIDIVTSGYGYNSTGLFKLLYFLLDEPMFKQIPEYIVFKYDYSIIKENIDHPLNNTMFDSFSVTFNNIDRLIMSLFK